VPSVCPCGLAEERKGWLPQIKILPACMHKISFYFACLWCRFIRARVTRQVCMYLRSHFPFRKLDLPQRTRRVGEIWSVEAVARRFSLQRQGQKRQLKIVSVAGVRCFAAQGGSCRTAEAKWGGGREGRLKRNKGKKSKFYMKRQAGQQESASRVYFLELVHATYCECYLLVACLALKKGKAKGKRLLGAEEEAVIWRHFPAYDFQPPAARTTICLTPPSLQAQTQAAKHGTTTMIKVGTPLLC